MKKKYTCIYDNGRYFINNKQHGSFTFWSDDKSGSKGNIESARTAYWKLYGKNLHNENILKIEECCN